MFVVDESLNAVCVKNEFVFHLSSFGCFMRMIPKSKTQSVVGPVGSRLLRQQ